MALPSAKFAAVFDALPRDVQDTIVQKQLIPLLDSTSQSKKRKILKSASRMKRRHANIPVLDIKAKKREVNSLLDELHRDSKRSFIKERSHRAELLEETVESVTSWLNDIWRVVYEHNVDFMLAHRCLLFTVNTLYQVGHGRASCRCAFSSMYVPIALKTRTSKVIKSWNVNGAHNIDEVLHFIWRDLFLSLLATGNQRFISKIPEMLDEIEDVLGWTALERLLYGGRKCPHDVDDPDEIFEDSYSDEDDEDAYTDEDSDLDDPVNGLDNWLPYPIQPKSSPSHAKHWSPRISMKMPQFRQHVHAAMMTVFKVNPSLRLYSSLVASSNDPDTTSSELMRWLADYATSCPEAFAAAIDIHSLEGNRAQLISLLNTHSHLLRPRDAVAFQGAILSLANDPVHQPRALEMVEKEMLDTARAVRAALSGPFALVDMQENRVELEAILKLRSSAPGRQDRIEHWVDNISTPGAQHANPLALAAMVMGMFVPALDGTDDGDMLGYLDIDPNDPDTEDLRDEFRPRLKQRFEGWADTAVQLPGGPQVALKVYKELVKTMPWLRAADVVEEMAGRLADKPSKQYLVDAMDALCAFAKVQRRKLSASRAEKKRAAPATSATASTSTTPGTATPLTMPTAAVFDPLLNPAGGPFPVTVEDDRAETPPPPLEPVTPTQGTAPLPQAFAPPPPPAPAHAHAHAPQPIAAVPAGLFGFYAGLFNGPPPPQDGFFGWQPDGMDDVD
ncbi:uncharacterized protein BXZ73DRAFT_89313 [Epithele typhae]|uniref:uncharacterized protein n=1 Tax=Epithele typhae TaxID=378194 RepID=UPI002008E6AE|nr:uncharacterized protein BXZ73DRAFT_89313 [Epithele typhae]KAH9936825.1 hypothetical protein BXZ73DRAFT_89313 [Epithele typhae]